MRRRRRRPRTKKQKNPKKKKKKEKKTENQKRCSQFYIHLIASQTDSTPAHMLMREWNNTKHMNNSTNAKKFSYVMLIDSSAITSDQL